MSNKPYAFGQALEITKIAAANIEYPTPESGEALGEFLDVVYEAICKVNDKANSKD